MRSLLLAILYGTLVFQNVLAAEVWPSRPIKLVVTFPPGGSTDVTGRVIAEKLRAALGASVVVENRAGAGGNIGADAVAKSAPDGYTLLMATSSHVTNISLYKSLPYDFIKDFAPVSTIAFIPNVLVVNPNFIKTNTLQEFIKLAKDKGGSKLNYGTGGSGTSQHLSNALFNSMIGVEMEHIPYKGGAPTTVALLAGEIQVVCAPLIEVLSHITSGKLKPLGVTTKDRSALLPDVPAIGEILPGYEVALWNSILAPAGTPPEIVDKLNAGILKVLADPEVKDKLAKQGSEPSGKTPAEFRQFIATEIPKWAEIVRISGAHVE